MPPGKGDGSAADAGPVRRYSVSALAVAFVCSMLAMWAGHSAWNCYRAARQAPQAPRVGVEERGPLPAPARALAGRSRAPWRSPLRPAEGRVPFELSIPRLGERWTVVEGVGLADIRTHPGHYPGSALPGQIGNVAVAGHRLPGLFWDLSELHVGDRIVAQGFAYRVYDREIVPPTAMYVVSPDPDHPGRPAQRALLTLTTCLKTGHQAREIVHAVLEGRE